MLNLLIAIINSALISIMMRLGEGRMKNNMAVFVVNYIVCEIFALIFMGEKSLFPAEQGMNLAIGLGIVSGIMYLASFVFLQINIQKNGVVLSATFMKLGVLIPTFMAVIVFHEKLKTLQVAGIILAIVAIIMIHFEKEDAGNAKYKILLILMLVVCGTTDSTANIYDKLGNSVLKDNYLFFTFGASCICAFLLWLKEKQGLCLWDLIIGIGVGIPNYLSARFLIMALHDIPAVITYPVYSITTIVVVSLVSLVLFKEHLSRKKLVAMGIIFASIVLLNN